MYLLENMDSFVNKWMEYFQWMEFNLFVGKWIIIDRTLVVQREKKINFGNF